MQPGKQSGIRRVTSWQLVGAQLRHFRKLAGLTQAALAEQAGVGEDTIASIEQGRRVLQLDMAIQLDELLNTKGTLRVAVEKIPRKERYQALVKDFVQYEQEALSLLWYEPQLIPGLLQTEAYARFIFGCNYPPLEEEETERRVTERLGRQKILERKPRPVLNFILEESILHTGLGDHEMMREQLLHLRRCMDLPFVTIQIMPRNTPRHAALAGPLVLLETPDHDQLAYISGQLRAELYDEPADVSALMQRYGMLRSQALTVEESTRLLDALLDALLGETCPAQHTPPPAPQPSTGASPATATATAEPASKSPPTPPPSTSATPR
ncbi:helix-turn-helix domain-containing protein [Streptomyces anulatus]|uniref:Helix-turn-helix domain-containing protein n=1 Tax=Streptomyces anulatus TaxID=1892 RepID=A0A7K3RLL2_STRAQ|nr:helix-turn-helix domain-containing protein [Streptomyces anulatus]NED30882.1 helix-turn-helix domain-containing protein [Streptomyces anulatus]